MNRATTVEMVRLGTVLLLTARFCYCQPAEHPILQPNSYGLNFEGPALALDCVALLKGDSASFVSRVREKSPDKRRACVDQLLQSLTREPDFTAADFQNAMLRDKGGNLVPEDSQLALKMSDRIGVNLNVAEALGGLANARLIDDPGSIDQLIRCLGHPLLEVSRRCEDALISLTRHDYGFSFYYNQPPPPTQEARQRLIADWTEWREQMKIGHPLFDNWLFSQASSAVNRLTMRLSGELKGTVAYGYLKQGNVNILSLGPGFSETLFEYHVGRDMVSNWPAGTGLDWVGIRLFRPGIPKPRSRPAGDSDLSLLPIGEPSLSEGNAYRETFPGLDLEVAVFVGSGPRLRDACFVAVKEALAELRNADKASQPKTIRSRDFPRFAH